MKNNHAFNVGDRVRFIRKDAFGIKYNSEWTVYNFAGVSHLNIVGDSGRIESSIHHTCLELIKKGHDFKVGESVIYDGMKITCDGEVVAEKGYVCKIESLDGTGYADIHVNLTKKIVTTSLCLIKPIKKEEEKTFHSPHYESDSIEPITFITSNKLDFCRGSIIKYAFRAGKKKGQEKLDITKIIDYALLLAEQENIDFSREDAQKIIDYRFDWQDKKGGK